MSDELDDIRRALAASAPPGPDGAARKRARLAALDAFDDAANMAADTTQEKNSAIHQGNAEMPRQRVRQSGLMTLLRSFTMNLSLPSTKTLMMGGASVAVLTLAIVAVQNQQPVGIQQPPLGELYSSESGLKTQVGVDKGAAQTATNQADTEHSRIAIESRVERAAQGSMADLATRPAPAPVPSGTGLRNTTKADGFSTANRVQPQNLAATQGGAQPQIDARPETYREQGRDAFEEIDPNDVKIAGQEPVSTFSVDVDTASYTFMRKALNNGVLPQKDSVRVEELINYFPYDYPLPESRNTPFSTNVSLMQTPWNDDTKLMRIGIKGYELAPAEKPRSNLVFLLDTSGSMNAPDKLPLLINSFRLLVDTLDADDTVSIVVYAGSAGTVLEPTKVAEKGKILAALDRLRAGGSTAGGEGIRQAYALAQENFDKDGINRVILATDGDFNVGIRDTEELKGFVERKRDTGIYLSVLGFGRGNYNDALMQTLAQNGNGNAAYIDTLNEARKTLVEEASSTLFPIAKDVKIQVEFNPATVAEYRLIGYETRILDRQDFNNDKVDAGEIGAGHTVTALYEITPVGSDARLFDELRFEQNQKPAATETAWKGEVAFVRLRYKQPDADTSNLIEVPVVTTADETAPDAEARFAAAVAAYGQLLRGGRYTGAYTYDDVIELATGAKGTDPFGYRAEFVNLVRLAKSAAALERQ